MSEPAYLKESTSKQHSFRMTSVPGWQPSPLTATAIIVAALTGCAAPTAVVDANGPTTTSPVAANQTPPPTQSVRFAQIYQKAQNESGVPSNDGSATGKLTPTQIVDNRNLLNAGMALIYTNCSDFFIKEGRLQQKLNFTSGLVGQLSSTVTGVLGLVPAAGVSIPIVGLLGGGVTSGISVASANFLFGSDNIDDVRTLTMSALAAHESTVSALFASSVNASQGAPTEAPPKPTPGTTNVPPADQSQLVANFDWVTKQLADHQSICEPAKILSLAKQAISKANVCAVPTASSTNGTGGSATNVTPPVQAAAKGKPATPPKTPVSPLPQRVMVQAQPSCDPAPATTTANP